MDGWEEALSSAGGTPGRFERCLGRHQQHVRTSEQTTFNFVERDYTFYTGKQQILTSL